MHNITVREVISHSSTQALDASRLITNSSFAQHLMKAYYKETAVLVTDVLDVVIATKSVDSISLKDFFVAIMQSFLIFENLLQEGSLAAIFLLYNPDLIDKPGLCEDALEDITNLFANYNRQLLEELAVTE